MMAATTWLTHTSYSLVYHFQVNFNYFLWLDTCEIEQVDVLFLSQYIPVYPSVSQYIFLCPREVKSLTPASNNRREDWRTGLLTVHFTLFPWFHFFLPVPVFLILPSDEVGASKTHLATLSFIPKSQHVTVFAICSLILYKVVLVVVFIASAVCWQHWQVGLSFLVEE